MNRQICALASACLIAGCAPTNATEGPMNSSVTLLPERSVPVGANASLRYEGAADSRCPPDVRCVWAGEVAYRFTLSGPAGIESFSLTLKKPAFDAATFRGVHIALGPNPEPPLLPASAAGTAQATPHPVTVSITRQ